MENLNEPDYNRGTFKPSYDLGGRQSPPPKLSPIVAHQFSNQGSHIKTRSVIRMLRDLETSDNKLPDLVTPLGSHSELDSPIISRRMLHHRR